MIAAERPGGHVAAHTAASSRPGPEITTRAAFVSWIAAGLGFALAQLWFKGGRFFAGGDIPPFNTIGLRAELFSLWNHQSSVDGAPGYHIARWPEALIGELVRGVGLTAPISQRVFLGGCAALCAGTVAWSAAPVVSRRGLIVLSSVLVILSPLTMVSLPSQLTFVASAAVALGTGIALRTWQGAAVPLWPWVAMAIVCGYLTVNPPLQIVAIVWTGVCLTAACVFGPDRTWAHVVRLAPGVAAAASISVYWIVPYALSVLTLSESSSFVAQTDVSQWAWTHARASILNVVSLTGHWSWDHPEYHLVVTALDRKPLAWARYVLPLTAFGAPVIVRSGRLRRLSIALVTAAAVLVIVGKGLHGPFAGFNKALYDHAPGFWLLREPFPKMGAALLPVLTLLWALSLDGLADRARTSTKLSHVAPLVIATAFGLPALFNLPLISGHALRLPAGQSVHISVPEEWTEAAAAIDRAQSSGRVVQLPLGDYYQMPTTWGYYGADAPLPGLSRRTVLTRSPGGYFSPRRVTDRLLGQVETGVREGDALLVEEAMQRLGASILVVRSDLKDTPANRSFAASGPLVAGLAKLPQAKVLHEGPLVRVVEMPTVGLAATYSVLQRGSDPGLTLQRGVAEMATNAPGLGPDGNRLEGGVTIRGSADGVPVQTREAGDHTIRLAAGLPLEFSVMTRGDRYALVPKSQLEVDGVRADLLGEQDLGRSSELRALRVGDRLIVPAVSTGPVQIASGAKITILRSDAVPRQLPAGYLQDCARFDARSLTDVGINVIPRPDGDLLSAREHRACLLFETQVPPRASALQLVTRARTEAGPAPSPCVLIGPSVGCAPPGPIEPLSDGGTRRTIALPPGAASVSILQYADPGSPVVWARPTVEWLTPANAVALPDASAVVALAPAIHQLRVTGAGGSQIGERSEVANCGGYASPAEAGISLEDDGAAGFTLRAAQQRACTTVPVKNLGEHLAVRFQARGSQSATGGFCLWWDVLKTCAKSDNFEVTNAWRDVSFEVEVPAGVNEGQLFLYASPGVGEGGDVSYRSLEVRDPRTVSFTVGRTSARPPETVTTPAITRRHGGRLIVEVPPRAEPVLVRLAEGYSPHWMASDGQRTLPHLQVDGSANGWVVPPSTSPTVLDVRYRPQTIADLALVASVVSLFVVGAVWMRRRRPASGSSRGS